MSEKQPTRTLLARSLAALLSTTIIPDTYLSAQTVSNAHKKNQAENFVNANLQHLTDEIISKKFPRVRELRMDDEIVVPGYKEMCERLSEKMLVICTAFEKNTPTSIPFLSPKNFHILFTTNLKVNKEISPVHDYIKHNKKSHGMRYDFWENSCPSEGDCEEYVLCKFETLLKAGFPRESMTIALNRDRKGYGHLVLLVKFIYLGRVVVLQLDNLTNGIHVVGNSPVTTSPYAQLDIADRKFKRIEIVRIDDERPQNINTD